MLRLYTFCNFYLSSIQQGIQSAHIVSELFVDYRFAIGRKEEGAAIADNDCLEIVCPIIKHTLGTFFFSSNSKPVIYKQFTHNMSRLNALLD
jgi:hypothetical protein